MQHLESLLFSINKNFIENVIFPNLQWKNTSPQANFLNSFHPFVSSPHLFSVFVFLLYPSTLLSCFHTDAAEESKVEEAAPADGAAEATESKDD